MAGALALKGWSSNVLAAGVMAALFTSAVLGQTPTTIVRYNPDGPGGAGLKGPDSRSYGKDDWKATSYYYFKLPANPRVSTGIWETANFHAPLHKTDSTEFIHLLHGTITLADASGKEEEFHAGDNLLIPRGAEVQWKRTENAKEYWAIFDIAPPGTPAGAEGSAPAVIRLSADGPPGKGLAPHGNTKSYKYWIGGDRSYVGVWQTQPVANPDFHKNKYSELMVFLSGSVTLSTPKGQAEIFHAGDVALVPRGVDYRWSSDTARKFYVIFDFEPESAAAPAQK